MKYRLCLQWSSPKKKNAFFVKIFSMTNYSNSNNVCTADEIYLNILKDILINSSQIINVSD